MNLDSKTIVRSAEATRVETPADRPEIMVERAFDAPRETVFAMWTDSRELDQWWGPAGFSNTTHAFEFREGGTWNYTMHGPDGTDFPNHITWLEIVPPQRIVYDHGTDPQKPDMFHVSVRFTEQGDQTVIHIRMAFPTVAQRDEVITQYGALQGAKENLARLALHIEKEQGTSV